MAPETKVEPWEYSLRKYVLMLATLVATVTYGVGFNPPGGVWQENDGATGHRAGDPIIEATNKLRYLVFFYCNAFALVSSVLVIVLFLLLSIDLVEKKEVWIRIKPLRVLMVLDLLSFMGAYAAGSCRDILSTVYTSVLMATGIIAYLIVQMVMAWRLESAPTDEDNINSASDLELEGQLRKVLMLLSTFAVSITYVAGLNSPGGFWDNTEGGHRPGDTILADGHHKARLATFFICNTTAFMASLFIIMLLLGRKLHKQTTVRSREMFGCILVALVGLAGAYAAGSCREPAATAYVLLVVAACMVCILVQSWLWPHAQDNDSSTEIEIPGLELQRSHQSRSLLLLLATFATAITYQAGLDPPGGVWQENGIGNLAGDPILLMINASRYKIFFYCNSVACVASLSTIILVLSNILLGKHMVESVMLMELICLIAAYAAGASRAVSTSNGVLALGGAVLFYVVIHVIFFTLEQDNIDFNVEQAKLEKKRKLLYLLATLSMALSYQAGLTPPGGFWLQDDIEAGHQAGDPVLLYSNPLRYKAFFYCNSVSFMLSVTTMLLLVNPVLYRPAIRSQALTLCTVAGLSCLMGAYAAGSTQHLTTSIGIFILVALAFLFLLFLLLVFFERNNRLSGEGHEEDPVINAQERELILNGDGQAKKNRHAHRKHLMLLGILIAGVTYQAGLDPPGGVWQSNDGHDAGGPVMLENKRRCYLAFFYSNSTSFATSIVVILLLLLLLLKKKEWLHIRVMHTLVRLNLLALLGAYAAGSTRCYSKSLTSIWALITAVAGYLAINKLLHAVHRSRHRTPAQ